MKDLFTSVMNRFSSSASDQNGLYSALSGRMFNTESPEGELLPLATVSVRIPDSDPFMDKCVVLFQLYSCQDSDTEILDLYSALIALFDDCDLDNLGSPSNIGMERRNVVLFKDSGVWQCAVEYDVWVERQ